MGATSLWDPPSLTSGSAQLAPQRGAEHQRGTTPVAPLLWTCVAFPVKYHPRSTTNSRQSPPQNYSEGKGNFVVIIDAAAAITDQSK